MRRFQNAYFPMNGGGDSACCGVGPQRQFRLGYFGDDASDPVIVPAPFDPSLQLPALTVLPSVPLASSTNWEQVAIFAAIGAIAFTLIGGLFVGPGVSSAMRSRRARKVSKYQREIRALKAKGI